MIHDINFKLKQLIINENLIFNKSFTSTFFHPIIWMAQGKLILSQIAARKQKRITILKKMKRMTSSTLKLILISFFGQL